MNLKAKQFSDRLNEAMDDDGWPPKGDGRQVELGKKMKLTQKAVRKWTEGEGFPAMKNMAQLAIMLKVSIEWLATGRGQKKISVLSEAALQLANDYDSLDKDGQGYIRATMKEVKKTPLSSSPPSGTNPNQRLGRPID